MLQCIFSTLTISPALLADFTEYKCKIENSYGEDTGKMLLLMEGEISLLNCLIILIQ